MRPLHYDEPHHRPEWCFRLGWTHLASQGLCPPLDGPDYRQVLALWLVTMPVNVHAFIRANATRPRKKRLKT